MKDNLLRQAGILAGAAAVGTAALAAQYTLLPTTLPSSGEYFLTELARSQIGPISVGIALAWAFALGFHIQVSPLWGGLSMLAIFPVVALYEASRYRGSHNLLPFEMALVATWAIPLILAAWLGRSLARRLRRRNRWGGTEQAA